MTYPSAAFADVTAFDRRVFALGDCRRAIFGAVAVGLGTVTAAAVTAGFVTVAAGWIIAAALVGNPDLRARAPVALETPAPTAPFRRLADTADFSGLVRVLAHPAYAPDSTVVAEFIPAAAPISASAGTLQLPPQQAPERANSMPSPLPLPPPRPLDGPQLQAQHEMTRRPLAPAAPQIAAASPAPPASAPPASPSFNVLHKRPTPQQARDNSISPPAPDSRTAVYDIEAHTVYLPDGERLEAHSGLGKRLDDPRYVNEKHRGPTPPNIYDLALRSELFHGVRAIRLNPVADGNMFGRDGMLAHTYMLGPSGQSFGCVSFRDYPAFLQAFLKGEIDRLVVVPHLEREPWAAARARRGYADQYVLNNR